MVVVRFFTRTFPNSNVWVLHDGNEAALIDSGYGDDKSVQARLDYFKQELPELNFRYIAITHHHFDHSSGGRKLREALRAETAINPIDEELLHTPSESNEDLPDEDEIAQRAKVWHEEAFRTPIDIQLADGDEVRIGGLTDSGGAHPRAHGGTQLLLGWSRPARSSPAITCSASGTSAIGPPPRGDMEQYLQSLLRMRELQSKLMAPGHGPAITATDDKVGELLDHRHTPRPPDHRPDRSRLRLGPAALSRALPGDPEGAAPRRARADPVAPRPPRRPG